MSPRIARLPYQEVISPSISVTRASGTRLCTSAYVVGLEVEGLAAEQNAIDLAGVAHEVDLWVAPIGDQTGASRQLTSANVREM